MPARDAEHVFHQALAREPDERAVYLREACGDDLLLRAEVEQLLAAHRAAGSFMATRDETPSGSSAAGEQAGAEIGPYRLLQHIGEGGFGTVWLAEQRVPVKRRVALKLVKLGMDTKQVIARFEAERQALAMMDHPNIARVFDAGATETGRPYFVMEYIRGVPILEYCNTERLDTRERLRLFIAVCKAIQHAHQKGIIHRDIKPSNVLVTMHDGVPVPKVIDFGIAKATNQELTERTLFTQHRQLIGTPAYMSPEQAEMSGLDIDTRADIYALGVLLYELLTGTTPFDSESLMSSGYAEMMRIIREEEPHRPSARLSSLGDTATVAAQQRRATDARQLGSLLRGDLDWIVMKCLEKDRTRRYDSATGLASDVERHLADEPVLAGPPSARYRLGKFVRRRRSLVAGAIAVVLVLALGAAGTGVGLVAALRAKESEAEQRRVAEERFGAAQAYVRTIADEVYPGIQPLIGATEPLAAMTRATSAFLDALAVGSSDSPDLRVLAVRMLVRKAESEGGRYAANTSGDARRSLETMLRARELLATVPVDFPDRRTYFDLRFDVEDGIASAFAELGELRQALEAYLALEAYCLQRAEAEKSAPLGVARADWDPTSPRWGLDLLAFRIGHIHGQLGDHETQLKRYESVALRQIASGIDVETAPAGKVHQLSVCHWVLMSAFENLGRYEEAREQALCALDVVRAKTRRWPNDARFARDLVDISAHVALVSARAGDDSRLDELVAESLRAGEVLVERDPRNGAFANDYLSALMASAGAYELVAERSTGPERIERLRRAVALWTRACEDERLSGGETSPSRDAALAEAHRRLAETRGLLRGLEAGEGG